MKYRAKTYCQFINEAYIDSSGELQDFEAPGEDDYEFQLLDHAQRIQEYLEESGADRVRLMVDGGVIRLKFEYQGSLYIMELDIDNDVATVRLDQIIIPEDSVDSIFDLLASTGLEFLMF